MNGLKNFKVVFVASHDWWEIRQEDFVTADDFRPEALEELFPEGSEHHYLNDCDEAFACTIEEVDEQHTAIQPGDVVVSHGVGSDKYFLRAN